MSVTVFDNLPNLPQVQADLLWLGAVRASAIQEGDVEFRAICDNFGVTKYSRNGVHGVSGVVDGHEMFAEFDPIQGEWAVRKGYDKGKMEERYLPMKFLSFIGEMTALNGKVIDRIKNEVEKNKQMKYLGVDPSPLGHVVVRIEYLGTVPGLVLVPDKLSEPIMFMYSPMGV